MSQGDPAIGRRLRPDLAPLRSSRGFRVVFASRTVTAFGTLAVEVALLVQAKQLTGSPLAVALLGVAELVPLLVFGLYGGVLADRFGVRVSFGGGGHIRAMLWNGVISTPRLKAWSVSTSPKVARMAATESALPASVPPTAPVSSMSADGSTRGRRCR